MKDFFKKMFRRRKEFKPQPKQLRIDGVKTALTPKADEAEIAAQALLETLSSEELRVKSEEFATAHKPHKIHDQQPHDAAYYRDLAEKIRTAREAETRAAMRYVAYCEEQLKMPDERAEANSSLFTLHSSLSELERGLYQHQDTVEREGGELLKRWQHCLANVLVRQMEEEREATEDGRRKMEDNIGSGGGSTNPNE